jgi:2',3'-cyclic-nucleotide 2'-phosphodiesterase (5'-nucleotidase family)
MKSRTGGPEATGGERRVTFLTVNDVYRLDGVAAGRLGGLHRLRTLRKWIEKDVPNVILLHAGDFLSPSLVSQVFHGAQMVDAMNELDGDGAVFDRHMFVAFGNHEFDESRCDKENPPLNKRVAESQFTWLAANLDFPNCPSMKGMLDRRNVRKDGIVINVNHVKVGIFGIGLTPDKDNGQKYPRYEREADAARRSIDYLKKEGAELIVAVTHLLRKEDEALIREFAPSGLDLLVGGHDHANMVLLDDAEKPRGFKADSEARTAWQIDVRMVKGEKPRIEARLIALNEAIPPDAKVSKLAASWSKRADDELCARRAKERNEPYNPDCLSERVGQTRTEIELEEAVNRTRETSFGSWLADLIIERTGADVAIINSGSLGLDENLEPGSKILLRQVIDIFRYDDVVVLHQFEAASVCDALRHGFGLPGRGAWPHVAGARVEIRRRNEQEIERVDIVKLGKANVDCASREMLKVASIPFLFCGGDDYKLKPDGVGKDCMRELQKNPDGSPKGPRLSYLAEEEIRKKGNLGISPKTDGRVQFIDATP